MRILEVINLHGTKLNDPNWLNRLKAPGLADCFCLLGAKDVAICVDDGNTCRLLDSGQLALLPPGDIVRLESRTKPPQNIGGQEHTDALPVTAPTTLLPAAPSAVSAAPFTVSDISTTPPAAAADHSSSAKNTANSSLAEASFVGAVFFKLENSSQLENILQLLLRQSEVLFADNIVAFYKTLYGYFAGQGVFSMQAAYHYLVSFLYRLAEGAAGGRTASGENVYIERALELMNMRVHGQLNLKALADEVHLSEAHLIRLFRQRTQMSPMKYFMRLKVHAAANMVIQGVKIKDVADFTGFYNDAHFSKQFKKYMGVPPKEYKPCTSGSKKQRLSDTRKSFSFLTSVLSDFIDAIPDMVFFKDSFYVYRLCNAAFSEYVGLSKEDICGQTDYTIFPREIAEDYRRYDSLVMKSRKAHANEEWVFYPDGRSFLLEAYKSPFLGPDQELLGLVGVCRDITARSAPHTGTPKPGVKI